MLAAVWTLIALLSATLFGMFFYLGGKIDALGARLDAQTARIDASTQALLDHVQQHSR